MRRREIRSALVDGKPFKVVWSVLLLTESCLSYLALTSALPAIAPDVIAKTGDLLKLFDSRARALVLGAQAIHSAARLKNISGKHLAMTSQSISLLLALLPHLRAALLAQLPPKVRLPEPCGSAAELTRHSVTL